MAPAAQHPPDANGHFGALLAGNLRHVILLLDELRAVGIGFVTLGEGIDTTSPTGRLVLHVLGAIAEFERDRIRERLLAGLA